MMSNTPFSRGPREARLSASIAITLAVVGASLVTATHVAAQESPAGNAAPAAGGGDDGEGAAPGPGVTVIQLPPQGGGAARYDPDAHLGSSSHAVTDIGKGDSFDNARASSSGAAHGNARGAYVVDGDFTPEGHVVRRGETLWEIASRYYQNPYQWPRVWAFNPQIQNPHWVYPGDRVRLRDVGSASGVQPIRGLAGPKRRTVPPQTVFLRETGWVDDKKADAWGEIVGSPEEHLFLHDGEDVYVQIADNHEVNVGDELTLYRPIRTVESDSEGGTGGQLVSIRGTIKIDRYNPKTRMARAMVMEVVDTIERGTTVGPIGRKFDVVPPVPSDTDIEASILASIYPFSIYGQNQVVFLDRGEKEGLRPGQRFFAISRGDPWIDTTGTMGTEARKRPRIEDDERVAYDKYPTVLDPDSLPDETYAEVRVLRVHEHTSAALVVAAKHEIERNARLVSRKGM